MWVRIEVDLHFTHDGHRAIEHRLVRMQDVVVPVEEVDLRAEDGSRLFRFQLAHHARLRSGHRGVGIELRGLAALAVAQADDDDAIAELCVQGDGTGTPPHVVAGVGRDDDHRLTLIHWDPPTLVELAR